MTRRIGSPLDELARRRALTSPRIEAALSRLRAEKIEVTELEAGHYLVAGRYDFFPIVGTWRGGDKQGGGVRELIQAVKEDRA